MSKNLEHKFKSSIIDKGKSDKINPNRVFHEDNSELFKKKLLKGKLIKLINESIIKTTETNNQTNENQFSSFKSNFPSKANKNFSIKFFPNIIGNDLKYTTVVNDYYMTPQELISKNFTHSQIQSISSNPMYFKLPENFLEIELFKKRKLIDVLEREEKNNLPVVNDKFHSENFEITKKNKKRNIDHLRSIFPSIDISAICKEENERSHIKDLPIHRNKLFLTKDLGNSLTTSRNNYVNISSISGQHKKLIKYESNKINLLKRSSVKHQIENHKFNEQRDKIYHSRLKEEEENQLILKYNDKILHNYKEKKKYVNKS